MNTDTSRMYEAYGGHFTSTAIGAPRPSIDTHAAENHPSTANSGVHLESRILQSVPATNFLPHGAYRINRYPPTGHSHPSQVEPARTAITYQCQYDCDASHCHKSVGGTKAEVKQHLRDYHGFRGSNVRVECRWKGCKRLKKMRGDSLARHIVGYHMQASRVRCSRCFGIFSRLDSLRSHMKGTPCEGGNPNGLAI
ncbi:hypothetical protein BV22DRAFT_1034908 [Leucogyrophana mollusca]|uniref:Uncharacterized protein n=1 Tax=Leucogyrophana mollusca TaxID=85980 RepID=A0ACB8BHI8_9AGAM|nr:hypothetical protein BV22DRAFT_1034908 [Leucogyrophana mollusca]